MGCRVCGRKRGHHVKCYHRLNRIGWREWKAEQAKQTIEPTRASDICECIKWGMEHTKRNPFGSYPVGDRYAIGETEVHLDGGLWKVTVERIT